MRVSATSPAAARQQQAAALAGAASPTRAVPSGRPCRRRRRRPSSSIDVVAAATNSSSSFSSAAAPIHSNRSSVAASAISQPKTAEVSTPSSSQASSSSSSSLPTSTSHNNNSDLLSSTKPPLPSLEQLPRPLRDSVVVLSAPNPHAPGGKTAVYVLGVSHVSKVSLERITELMSLVRPEVAVLELCKDRVGLLLPQKRGPQLWHAPEVKLLGLPFSSSSGSSSKDAQEKEEESDGNASSSSSSSSSSTRPPPPPYPFTPEQLLRACRCSPGAPVSTADIELDCVSLQATGLFRSVRPATSLPPTNAAPQFVRGLVDVQKNRKAGAAVTGEGGGSGSSSSLSAGKDEQTRMQPVLPLGDIRFTATPRETPPVASLAWRLSSALEELVEKGEVSVDREKLDAACEADRPDAAARLGSGAGGGASSSSSSPGVVSVGVGTGGATVAALAAAAPLFRAAVRVKGKEEEVSVQYEGIGGPSVEAVLRPGPPRGIRGAPETGLEASADGGRGGGIEPFVPYRGPLALTKTMRVENLADVLELELESVDDVSPVGEGDGGGGGGVGVGEEEKIGGGNFVARWPPVVEKGDSDDNGDADDDKADNYNEEEEGGGGEPESAFDPLLKSTATWLTKEYGRHQSAAAAAAGVADGDAWRTALDAASRPSCSSSDSFSSPAAVQVLLGDAPASRTSKKIAAGVLKAFPLCLGAAVASVAAAVAVLSGDVSNLPLGSVSPSSESQTAAVVASAVAASLASFWPIYGPLLLVERFSKLPAEKIEADVAPTEPLSTTSRSRFGGEDAIMGWPGAKKAVVDERDAFMASSIYAAATGESFVPAFVLDRDNDGRAVWRYAMPKEDDDKNTKKLSSRVVPPRGGEGVYEPLQGPRAVVAVVGTAHVAGIRDAWKKLGRGGGGGGGGRDPRAVAAASLDGDLLV